MLSMFRNNPNCIGLLILEKAANVYTAEDCESEFNPNWNCASDNKWGNEGNPFQLTHGYGCENLCACEIYWTNLNPIELQLIPRVVNNVYFTVLGVLFQNHSTNAQQCCNQIKFEFHMCRQVEPSKLLWKSCWIPILNNKLQEKWVIHPSIHVRSSNMHWLKRFQISND